MPRASADAATTVAVAVALVAVAFGAQGGLQLGRTTVVEMALLVGSGLVVAASAMAAPGRTMHGALAFALFVVLGVFTVASISWAVQPSDAWVEANRTLTYVAVFAAAMALVRLMPERWPAVLGGVALAAVALSTWALVTKVFPGALDPDELYTRLRAPFTYWNATGLEAALAVPPLLWLGARRTGPPLLNALAYPALGLALVALMLAYSRGALLALAVGLAFWFAFVPLRLRAVVVLATSVVGGGLIVAWAFAQDALSQDGIPLEVRTTAGHQLGVGLLGMVAVLLVAGLAAGFGMSRRPLTSVERRRAGLAVACVIALGPIVLAGTLATSDRGLTGSISYAWHQLTNPNVTGPANTPGRLTSAGSARARYWSEAWRAWRDHPAVGVGAGGYATVRPRYRRDLLEVRHAHGYVVQTLADLGWIGLAISLAALGAWAWAAAVATGLRRRDRASPSSAERVGLLTMAAVVVVFGVHSLVDWTWFVPGNACVALLCAGWVAGRGPLSAARADPRVELVRLYPRSWLADRAALSAAAAALLVALVTAWAVWQPLRSVAASDAGLDALARGDLTAARRDAQAARERNPLSLDPLTVLAIVDSREGRREAALRDLEQEVTLQPANHQPWLRLADFQLNALHQPRQALRSLGAAAYLDPLDPITANAYLDAYRQATGTRARAAPPRVAPSPARMTPPGTT